jgi:hypothetical protein
MQKNIFIISLLLLCTAQLFAQDSTMLKVHFLYGSKPKKAFKHMQKKWFGGLIGGHAGIECGDGKILHFLPHGKFHKIAKPNKHGRYVYNSYKDFYEILGGSIDSNQQTVVYIPVSMQQKQKYDSIVNAYTSNTPYDYAFIGYRCGSATYDGLSQLGILPRYNANAIKWKIFYPRKVRKRILRLAKKYHWHVETKRGCRSRKWERDW